MKIIIWLLLCLCGFGIITNSVNATVSNEDTQTIVLSPGWNTFSTPKVLDSITFQSGGTGLYFYGLTSTGWQIVNPTIANIKPLEGFLINNTNSGTSDISLSFRANLSPMEMIFQKQLHAGWNILGITTANNPFGSIGPNITMSLDFTRSSEGGFNYANKIANTYYSKIGLPYINNLLQGESYGIFMQTPMLYAGIQNGSTGSGYVPSIATATLLTNGIKMPNKNDQTLGSINISAGDQDIIVTGFTLTSFGSSNFNKKLSNVKVYRNSVFIGTGNITDDNILSVSNFSDTIIAGNTQTYELRADFLIDFSNSDLGIKINSTTDIHATELATGYNPSVILGNPSINISFSNIELTLTKNSTGSKTVAPGTSNVVLFDGKVTFSGSFDVTEFTLTANAGITPTTDTGELAAYNSLTLTVNGVDYDLLSTAIGAGVYTFNKTSDKFRIDAGSPANIRLTANLSNTANEGVYNYGVTITKVKSISTSNAVVVNKSINGDNVTVATPTLTVKASSVAAPSASKIYSNASNLEIGRFGLEAKSEDITVREITLTNTAAVNPVADFSLLVSGTNVKLVNVADGTQASATVTVTAGEIKLTGMSIKVLKDTTANFKILADTQGDLTTTFTGANNKLMLTVAVKSASSSSLSSVVSVHYNTAKIYTVSVIPPTVTLVKKSANVFLATITNADADVDITLDAITAQVRPVSVANNNYSAVTCIRDEGSSDKCDLATSGTGAVPGAAKTFTFGAPINITKNSNVTREIFVDSNFVSPSDLQGEITALLYNTSVSETYSVVAQ